MLLKAFEAEVANGSRILFRSFRTRMIEARDGRIWPMPVRKIGASRQGNQQTSLGARAFDSIGFDLDSDA